VMAWQPPPQSPDGFVVKIIEPPGDVEGLADVLLGALGLTGIMVLGAVVLAVLFAGALYLFRLKFSDPFPSASEHQPGQQTEGGPLTR
jgi:hypothetical protein